MCLVKGDVANKPAIFLYTLGMNVISYTVLHRWEYALVTKAAHISHQIANNCRQIMQLFTYSSYRK